MDQNKVIERIKAGREEEMGRIYRKYRSEFLGWLERSFGCSEDDGKDIFQNVLIIFYEKIISGKLKKLDCSVKTYLFAIGKNKIQELKRNLEREEVLRKNYIEDDSVPERGVDLRETKLKCVEECVVKLGDPCSTILHLYYYHRLSISEISKRLDYKNADSLKNQKYKCMQRLKRIYDIEIRAQSRR